MFKNTKAFASFSVNDIEVAKHFYSTILGIEVTEEAMGVLTLHISSDSNIMIYPKPNHLPATFTVLNFPVTDIEKTVGELAKLGVSFEQYSGQIQTDENGICHSDGHGPDIAWFKDPAGNILSVLQQD